MKKLILAAALCAATAAAQAAPIQYNFAYDTGIGLLSGSLMGELQADQNTIVISSMLDFVKFDGVAGPSLPYVFSFFTLFTGGQTVFPARTTLDGSLQDIYALDRDFTLASGRPDGFAIIAGLNDRPFDGQYGAGASFGGEDAPTYVAANWSIQAVPEPASLLLTGLALVGLVASRRRVPA